MKQAEFYYYCALLMVSFAKFYGKERNLQGLLYHIISSATGQIKKKNNSACIEISDVYLFVV